MESIRKLGGQHNGLLLGITGGIASGKSTVTQIFKDLGAPLIDFDVLARRVVLPGEPAWKDIVAYFGKKILLREQAIDRKKLSDLVFRDTEKRKNLEGFIHPRIIRIFMEQLEHTQMNQPGAVIQVDIPLMIEQDLQHMCHKLLVVFLPPEKQIERLMCRDGITAEKARKILDAQMPISEKLPYADFVVYNDKTLKKTKKQVKEIWYELTKFKYKKF